MKLRSFRYICVICAVAFVHCTLIMPSDFNRIDEGKLRVINVAFLPRPDVGPGDTVTARAYFAGSNVTRIDNFALAYDGFGDEAGWKPVEKPLTIIARREWFPDSCEFTFAIPDSVFLHERAWALDSSVQDSVARLMLQPKEKVVATLTGLPDSLRSLAMDRIARMSLWTSTLFTAYAENGASLRVLSTCAVRFNSRYPEYLPVNNNPQISWVTAYAVPRSEATNFDPYGQTLPPGVRTWRLFDGRNPASTDTTIVVDTGYSYFFACDNGIHTATDSSGDVTLDTLWEGVPSENGSLKRESISYMWFFQNVDSYSEDPDSMLVIDNSSSHPVIEFKPPILTSMRRFKIWVSAKDELYSSTAYRPNGIGVCGVAGVFTYTDEYRKRFGD